MADSVNTDDKEEKQTPAFESTVRKRSLLDKINLGYLGAGAATLLNAWHSVNNYFYKEKADLDKYNNIRDERDSALSLLEEKPSNHTLREMIDSIKEQNRIHRKFTEGVDQGEFGSAAKRGFFLGNFQKLEKIQPHQRTNVAIQVGTVFAIAMGAIFSFSRERRISLNLEREEAKNDKLNAKQNQSL